MHFVALFSNKNLCLTWLRKTSLGTRRRKDSRHPSSKRSIVPMKRAPSSCLGNPSIRCSLPRSGQSCFPM